MQEIFNEIKNIPIDFKSKLVFMKLYEEGDEKRRSEIEIIMNSLELVKLKLINEYMEDFVHNFPILNFK